MKQVVLLFFLLPFCCSIAYAQHDQPVFSLGAAVVMPTGDFADDGGADGGFAMIGFALIGDYLYPVGNLLGWITSATIAYNPAQDDILGGADGEPGFWINVPLLTGLRYETPLSPTASLFGQAQVGFNYTNGPDIEADINSQQIEVNYGSAVSFGFSVGVGITLNPRINVSTRYFDLGKPELEVETVQVGGGGETELERPISFFQIGITYRLR